MDEALKTALTVFVQQMIGLVEAGKEQLPAVLQQVVAAAILSATVWWWVSVAIIAFGVLLLVLGVVLSQDTFDGDVGVGLAIFGCFVIIVGGLMLASNWYDFIYAQRFPQLVILNYLRHLL